MQDRLLGDKKESSGYIFYVIVLLIFIFIFNLINNFIIVVQVDGASMNNTLSHGDVLFVDKNFEIERGDVIIFDRYYGKLIKRVIALEGDELYCQDGEVFIKRAGEKDFSKLEEDYVKGLTYNISITQVKEGTVYVLGDNRENSKDSREFGAISISEINGEVSQSSIKNKSTSTFFMGWIFKLSEFFGR